MFGKEIVVGLGLVCLTTIIHALMMTLGFRIAEWRYSRFGNVNRTIFKAMLTSVFTGWMFIGVVFEALVWASYYLSNPEITALPDLSTALYFSMVTFTSVGYGDVVLSGNWRLLASFQAANGVIIFGWTTALIFYFIQQVYKKE